VADVVNPDQVVQLIQDLKSSREALEGARTLAADEAAKVEAAKVEAERLATIVGLVPGGVWLRSGDFIPLGERFENGLFSGETLASVDLRGRAAVMASGRRVRLRLSVSAGAASKEETRSSVPGDVPRMAPAGGGPAGDGTKVGERVTSGPGPAASSLRP
jgi:hypothetical protein